MVKAALKSVIYLVHFSESEDKPFKVINGLCKFVYVKSLPYILLSLHCAVILDAINSV
jgi:hypothetical protein